MNNRIAMFPGTFDPPTLGHIDIIKRSAKLYDKLYVVIANNALKNHLFNAKEREQLLKEILCDASNVEVVVWDKMVVDFARMFNVGVIIRGVRALADFSYEFELAETNRLLLPEIEVLFMPTDPKYFLLRSSSIKEMASFGADISKMVPVQVVREMQLKLKQLT